MTAIHLLSKSDVRTALPGDKKYTLNDGGGLRLLISPSGTKTWQFRYRDPKTKTSKTCSLGEMPLDSAREQASELSNAIRSGESITSPTAPSPAASLTFQSIAERWLHKEEHQLSPETYKRKKARLENHILPKVGNHIYASLKPRDLLPIIEEQNRLGHAETATRLLNDLVNIDKHAQLYEGSEHSPTWALSQAKISGKTTHRPAITDPDEFGKLLRALAGSNSSMIVRSALNLAPLIFVRPGELVTMKWEDINFDSCVWSVTHTKTQNSGMKESFVPLSRQAMTIIENLRAVSGNSSYVFPNTTTRAKHPTICRESLAKAIRNTGYCTRTQHCPHGFRASAFTLLFETLKFPHHIVDMQLGHVVKDANGRAYNRATFLDERREMMQRWADYCSKLKHA